MTARHDAPTRPDTTRATGTVRSADGTVIGYHRTGQGIPTVLLHGTSADSASWALSGPHLARELTLLAVDRRGRGLSDLGEPHAVQREVEDVAALVDALDQTPHLIGHSYGAMVALAAAAQGVPVRSLVLYEPPLTGPRHLDVEELAATCQEALDAGDREGVLRTFYTAIGEGPAVDMLRATPNVFQRFLGNAHTIPRELRSTVDFADVPAARVTVPTLLLVGSASTEQYHESIATLAAVVPDARTEVLTGQGHLGHALAPEAFAATVLDFLRTQGGA